MRRHGRAVRGRGLAPRGSRAATSASAVARASPTTPIVDGPVRADRVGVEVDLRDARAGADQRAVARRPLVQRGAEGDDRVGLAEQPRGGRRREPAGDADRERVAGEQPVGDRRGREHGAGQLAEPPQRRPGAGQHRAAAGDDRGPLGAGQQRRRASSTDPGRGGASSGSGGGSASGRTRPPARRAAASARPPAARRARAAPRARRRPSRSSGPCTRSATAPTASTSPSWSILKFERSCAAGVSAREHEQRRPALGRLGQPGDRVRQARALVHAARGEPAAHARVPVGHADRAALVAGGVERHAGVAQRVGERQVAAAEQAEDGVDAERGQRPADRLRDLHVPSEPSAGRAARRPRRGSPRGSGSTSRTT